MGSVKITNAASAIKNLSVSYVTDNASNKKIVKQIYLDDTGGTRRLLWEANLVHVTTGISNMMFNMGPTGTVVPGIFVFRLILQNSNGKTGVLYIPYGNYNSNVGQFELPLVSVGSQRNFELDMVGDEIVGDLGQGMIYIRAFDVLVLVWSSAIQTQIALACHVASGGSTMKQQNIDCTNTGNYQQLVFPDNIYLQLNVPLNVDIVFDDPI